MLRNSCLLFVCTAFLACSNDSPPTGPLQPQESPVTAPGRLLEPSGLPTPQGSAALRIAVMGPLTGPAAGYGTSQIKGVKLAVEEINRGIHGEGPKVELVVVDDEGDMSAAADRVVQLIYEENVSAIIGAINSSVTHVVEMVCAKARVPMITTTSTDPSITRTGTYWAFRCLADDLLQGHALAHRIFEVDEHQKVAILMQDNRYGKMGGREIARIAAERGHPAQLIRVFDGKADDWSKLISELANVHLDAIVLWGLYDPCGRLLAQMRGNGIDALVYGADGMVHPTFIERAGKAAEGVVVTLPFNPKRDSDVTRRFLSSYRQRYSEEADSFSAHSYDAMLIVWTAALRGDCIDRTCLKDNMLQTEGLEGATGTITLDEEGNDTRPVELAVIRNGKLVPLPVPRDQ